MFICSIDLKTHCYPDHYCIADKKQSSKKKIQCHFIFICCSFQIHDLVDELLPVNKLWSSWSLGQPLGLLWDSLLSVLACIQFGKSVWNAEQFSVSDEAPSSCCGLLWFSASCRSFGPVHALLPAPLCHPAPPDWISDW